MTKNLIGPNESNDRSHVKNLRVSAGRAPASPLKRILTGADGVSTATWKVAGSVADECDVRAAFDMAP